MVWYTVHKGECDMPEKRKILLTIKGTQVSAEGETNALELVTEGVVQTEGETTRLTYQESEIVGTDGAMMTIEMQGGMVRILRTGEYGANFELLEGRKCLTLYTTPFGVMEMGAYPSVVQYNFDDGGGRVELQYELDVQGQFAGKNHLNMEWRERG